MVAVILALLGTAFGACPEAVGAVHVTREVAAIESAWSTMDAPAVYQGEDQLLRDIPCLIEAMPPSAAVALYRALALTRYVVGDRTTATSYLRSVREIDPAYVLPEALVGPTHPLRDLFAAAAPSDPPPDRRPLMPAAVGWLQVDGLRATSVPADRPFLFQHLDDAGLPLRTDLLASGAIPAYRALPKPVLREPRARSRALVATGAGAVVAGAAALVAASVTRNEYQETPTWESERATRLKQSNLALGITGYSLAAVGAGLGALAVVDGRW